MRKPKKQGGNFMDNFMKSNDKEEAFDEKSVNPGHKFHPISIAKMKKDRPASNKIDRFGRIAFNKNKELSQASLQISDEESKEN